MSLYLSTLFILHADCDRVYHFRFSTLSRSNLVYIWEHIRRSGNGGGEKSRKKRERERERMKGKERKRRRGLGRAQASGSFNTHTHIATRLLSDADWFRLWWQARFLLTCQLSFYDVFSKWCRFSSTPTGPRGTHNLDEPETVVAKRKRKKKKKLEKRAAS